MRFRLIGVHISPERVPGLQVPVQEPSTVDLLREDNRFGGLLFELHLVNRDSFAMVLSCNVGMVTHFSRAFPLVASTTFPFLEGT
jgi:hypothetical protein